jgi:hypothetical protein
VAKLVHILCTRISTDEKCLEHYHILNIAGKCYDTQLVAIDLILLVRDSAKPFWVCTYDTECCTWIP